jgi:ABC-type oligopeptide transport system substrate-binding subunit
MKSTLLLAGALVAFSSVAFAQCGPQSQTSNANTAGLGGSTHGRAYDTNQTARPTSANDCSAMPASETSNANGAGLGGSTHGRRW